jgi:hypothetical protein
VRVPRAVLVTREGTGVRKQLKVRPWQREHEVDEGAHSRRHIDIAVAAVMAHDRARDRATQPRAAIYVLD